MMSHLSYISLVFISTLFLNVWATDIIGPIVKPPAVENTHIDEEKRIDLERRIEADLAKWDTEIASLKKQIKSSRILTKQRARLKKITKELEVRRRVVRIELSKLREMAEEKTAHIRDHIDAEFRRMKEAYDKFLAE